MNAETGFFHLSFVPTHLPSGASGKQTSLLSRRWIIWQVNTGSLPEAGNFCRSTTQQRKWILLCVRKWEDFRPMLDLHCLNTCIACKKIWTLSIKHLLGMDQMGDWFTTINSEDAHFYVRGQSLSRCTVETVSAVCSFNKYIIATPTVSIAIC